MAAVRTRQSLRARVDGRILAEHGATVFLRQVLELGRFHADLHPANLFVTPDSRICYLDFGITGTTTPEQRIAIAQVLAATVYGDADRALKYSAELGLIVPEHLQPKVRSEVAELMGARCRRHRVTSAASPSASCASWMTRALRCRSAMGCSSRRS